MRTSLVSVFLVACSGGTGALDSGAHEGGSRPPDAATDAATAIDAAPGMDAGMDAQAPTPDAGFVAPATCAGPDPVLSLGTYPDTFQAWPNNEVYEATVLSLRTSAVSIVSSADLDRTIIAHVNALVYRPGEDPIAMMPDAGPMTEENYVGDDLTIELPAIGTLAVGAHIYLGAINYAYYVELPNILIAGEAVPAADHPSFLEDLVGMRDYNDDVTAYEGARSGALVVYGHVNETSGPFTCQFTVDYDYRAGVSVDTVICGAPPGDSLGVHTYRTELTSGDDLIFVLNADAPSACAFPPDASFGTWTVGTTWTFPASELPRLQRLFTTPPHLSL